MEERIRRTAAEFEVCNRVMYGHVGHEHLYSYRHPMLFYSRSARVCVCVHIFNMQYS